MVASQKHVDSHTKVLKIDVSLGERLGHLDPARRRENYSVLHQGAKK
jgi:hypothetical protein